MNCQHRALILINEQELLTRLGYPKGTLLGVNRCSIGVELLVEDECLPEIHPGEIAWLIEGSFHELPDVQGNGNHRARARADKAALP